MKSPFPGMDPYLEERWSDVHLRLIAFISEAIQPLLPDALRARAEERVLLESDEDVEQYRPDVVVVESGRGERRSASRQSAGAVTVEPVVIRREPGPAFDRFVQIIDARNGNRVVTAIEVLSPWNKAAGRLNREYLAKLDTYAEGGVSVVEIDLLRYPTRARLSVTEGEIPVHRRAAYVTCVKRAWLPTEWEAYPMPLRSALPIIPVPLRREDQEIGLELQPLIDRVYVAGGHDDIDYSRPPEPPLAADDAEWARELVEAAKRS